MHSVHYVAQHKDHYMYTDNLKIGTKLCRNNKGKLCVAFYYENVPGCEMEN